jgi:hypothetical protein
VKTVNVSPLEVPPPGPGVVTVTETSPADERSAAGTAPATPVVPINVVVSAPEPQFTVEQGSKFVPVTSSVNAELPTGALEGLIWVIAGAGKDVGCARVNCKELDAGTVALEAVTFTVPGNAVSVTEMTAVSTVPLTKVVGRGEPFQFTANPLTKSVPFTVKVRPDELQAGVEAVEVVDAESEEIVGATTEKFTAADGPPPGEGVNTVTATWPTEAISAEEIVVLSCVGPR